MMRYYAVLDPADGSTARNVFIVDDADDPVALVVLDHAQGQFVQNNSLIEYIAGDNAKDCAEITFDEAHALVTVWGFALPDAAAVRRLAQDGESG